MTDGREPWALVLGASSGFGEATARALAADGYAIAGVHLDRRQGQARVEEIKAAIAAHGREAFFRNMNAADDEQRDAFIADLRTRFAELQAGGGRPYVRVVLHSLAFGTLKPFLAAEAADAINRKNMEMTLDVMANSLVYWAQDLWRAGLLERGFARLRHDQRRLDARHRELRRRERGEVRPRVALPPAGHGVRQARCGRDRQCDPGRRHGHAGADADPRARRAHRPRHQTQSQRPHDHRPGRGRASSCASPRTALAGSPATSSAWTAASSSPAEGHLACPKRAATGSSCWARSTSTWCWPGSACRAPARP